MASRRTTAALFLAALVLVACTPSGSSGSSSAQPVGVRVSGHVTAGPTCPVERNPPDPACAPRPVVGGEVRVVRDDPTNAVVAQAMTDATGAYAVLVPPGRYRLEGGVGMPGIGSPAPVPFAVEPGSAPVSVDLIVDTGIR